MLHADLYRLERLGEVADLGLGELVEESAVAVVEWGDVAAAVLGRDALALTLEVGPAEHDRRIAIGAGRSWAPRWRAIEAMADEWGRRGAGRTR
jgi:tRNA A37 threonylcarbamoyladenosine biosynthesis protein TsaE